jgi:hypothetical protein
VLLGKPPFIKWKKQNFLVETGQLRHWRILVLPITADLWFFGPKFIPVSGEAYGMTQAIKSPHKI